MNTGKYWSGYIGDVLSKDRFTFNLGVRWDGQTAKNLDSQVPANAPSPTCFPPSFAPATPRTSRTGARSRLAWA